jgi:hypothetical protein
MSLLFKAIFEAIFGIRGRLITGVIFDAFSSTEHLALRVVIIAFSVGVAARDPVVRSGTGLQTGLWSGPRSVWSAVS